MVSYDDGIYEKCTKTQVLQGRLRTSLDAGLSSGTGTSTTKSYVEHCLDSLLQAVSPGTTLELCFTTGWSTGRVVKHMPRLRNDVATNTHTFECYFAGDSGKRDATLEPGRYSLDNTAPVGSWRLVKSTAQAGMCLSAAVVTPSTTEGF